MLPKNSKLWLAIILLQTIFSAVYAQEITSFRFDKSINTSLNHNIVCTIDGSEIYAIIPYNINVTNLIASFTTEQANTFDLLINQKVQRSGVSVNDFSEEVVYNFDSTGAGKIYKVRLIHTGLPTVYLYTDNQATIDSTIAYVSGNISVLPDKTLENAGVYNGVMQIKGRGNSTWAMPKKPYKIKLASKASLLGMPSDKEWVLLANYADKTLLRVQLAFAMSAKFGLPYTPRNRSVDVILNDEYVGTYSLTEQIKIATARVNIKEMSSSDVAGEKITGGYLLEVDERRDEKFMFETSRGVPFSIKEPDVNPEQHAYITNYVQEAEDALYGPDFTDQLIGYEAYLNTETFVNWYLVNELFKNNDAVFFSSVYMYKDRNGKLNMGPAWDFDISAGNINYNNNELPEGWWIRNSKWISRLFEDPRFKARVKARWNELKQNDIYTLSGLIDGEAAKLETAQKYNFRRWNILNTWVTPNPVVTGSYTGEINYLKSFMETRISWLDKQFSAAPFNLNLPSNNSTEVVHPYKSSNVTFTWAPSYPSIGYKVELYLNNEVFYQGFVNQNQCTISSFEMIGLLFNKGYLPGNTIPMKWRVYAMLDSDSIASNQLYDVNIKISEALSQFNLNTPLNRSVINIINDTSGGVLFNWESSRLAIKYKFFMLDNFGHPVLVRTVANNDTSVVIRNDSILDFMKARGISFKDSLACRTFWTSYAFLNDQDSLPSKQIRDILFYHIDSAIIEKPVTELAGHVYQNIKTHPSDSSVLVFSWTNSYPDITSGYKWKCTTTDRNWDDVLYEFSVSDTFKTISVYELDKIAKSAPLSRGDSITLKWCVFAFGDLVTDSMISKNEFFLNITRKHVLTPFNITSPLHMERIESDDDGVFGDKTLSFTKAGHQAIKYRLNISDEFGAAWYSDDIDESNTFNLTDGIIRELTPFDDSLQVKFSVNAYDDEENMIPAQEHVPVMLIKKEKFSGVAGADVLKEAIVFYPNPVTNNVINLKAEEEAVVTLFDVKGRKIQSWNTVKGTNLLKINHCNNGLYFLVMMSDKGSYSSKLIITGN